MNENESIIPEVTEEETRPEQEPSEFSGAEADSGEPGATGEQAQPERDFSGEVAALLTAFPDMAGKSLPDEVVNECVQSGTPLVRAYAAYRERSTRSRMEELRHSAENFLRAPVRAVSYGAPVENAPADPFLMGLNEY